MRSPTALIIAASIFSIAAVPTLSLGLSLKPPATAADVKGPDNAALIYNRAWLMLGPDVPKQFQDAVKPEASWAPDATLVKALEDNQDHLALIMKASRLPACDFGVEYDQGFEALMPHVGYLRRDARMLDADAVRLANAGDAAGAAERLATLFRMTDQCSDDGILISSLVGAAICKAAVNRTEILLDQNKLNPAAARVILQATRTIDKADPFGARASINAEGLVLVESARKNYTGPDAGKRFIEFLTRNEADDNQEVRAKISAMNGEQLVAALQQARGWYTDAVAVWNAPDALDKLNALSVNESKYGPLGSLVAPSLAKTRGSETEVKQMLDKLIARLETASK